MPFCRWAGVWLSAQLVLLFLLAYRGLAHGLVLSIENTDSNTMPPSSSPVFTIAPTDADDYGSDGQNGDGEERDSDDAEYEHMLELNSMMTLYFSQNATHGKIKLTKRSPGYLAFGVGSRMAPSVALIGIDISLNSGEFSTPLALYSVDDMMGGLTLLYGGTAGGLFEFCGMQDLSFFTNADMSELKFTQQLDKQHPSFTMFRTTPKSASEEEEEINIVFAGGPRDGAYSMHPHFGVLRDVDFSGSGEEIQTGTVLAPAMMVHIVTMTLGWGVFIPAAVITRLFSGSKYLRAKAWVDVHTWLSCIGVGLSVLGYFAGWYYVHNKKGIHLFDEHGQLGLAIVILALVQPLLGFGRHLLPRKYFALLHILCGFVLVFLALWNNVLGLRSFQQLFGETYVWNGQECASGVFSGAMGVSIMLVTIPFAFGTFVVMIRRILDWLDTVYGEQGVDNGALAFEEEGGGRIQAPLLQQRQERAAATTTAGEATGRVVPLAEFDESDNLQLFNGGVYDFTEFLHLHPGGEDVILGAGKDITEEFTEQGHSKRAVRMLQDYYVGTLEL